MLVKVHKNTQVMPRLSPELRERATGMLGANMGVTGISRRIGFGCVAIYRLQRQFQQTESIRDRPRAGRPRATTRANDRAIRLRHLRDRFLPATSSTNLPQGRRVSDRTIRRRLRAANLRPRRPYRGPFLTQRHRQEKLRCCQAGLRWRLNVEWSNMLFSDESRFSLYHSDGRARVYRRTGERYADCYMRQHDRCVGGSVMIWAGITRQNRMNLVFVNGSLNAARYQQDILATEVRQFINQHGPALTFQQYNARPHTARATQAFLQQHNINVLPWPSKSPDLNPIEHIWDELDRRVRSRPNQPTTLGDLKIALRAEWNRMPQGLIAQTILSMRRRIRAVAKARGGHTRY